MLVYCDTSTLLNNVKKHNDPKTEKELAALLQLLTLRLAGTVKMVRSRVVLREVDRTGDQALLMRLRADYEALDQVPLDEKVVGYHSQFNERGGVTHPLVEDVQSPALRDKLAQQGLKRRDAEHITQARANRCDVFLTRDERTIIKPHRTWLEGKLPGLKIRLPSELLAKLK